MKNKYTKTTNDLATAQKTAEQLVDESTAEIEKSIAEIEVINDKIRSNQMKAIAEEDARKLAMEYEELTAVVENYRKQKQDLLNQVDLPLPELSVMEGELVYKGQKWDNMSGAEQLKVSTSIVRKLKPQCGFVLIDKLEQMDLQTLQEFGAWLEQEQLQAIAARVTSGDEATIIIEDGEEVVQEIKQSRLPPASPLLTQKQNTWKGGF